MAELPTLSPITPGATRPVTAPPAETPAAPWPTPSPVPAFPRELTRWEPIGRAVVKLHDISEKHPGNFANLKSSLLTDAQKSACDSSLRACVKAVCSDGTKEGISADFYTQGEVAINKFTIAEATGGKPHYSHISPALARRWVVESFREFLCQDPPPPPAAVPAHAAETQPVPAAVRQRAVQEAAKLPAHVADELGKAAAGCSPAMVAPKNKAPWWAVAGAVLIVAGTRLYQFATGSFVISVAPPVSRRPAGT